MNNFPRIFGFNPDSFAAGEQRSLDLAAFTNDGDFLCWLDYLQLYTGDGNSPDPSVWIRPTNGPAWSRDAVPAYLLGNDFCHPGSTVHDFNRLYLEHPYPLGANDALHIFVKNNNGSARDFGMAAFGHKVEGQTKTPKEFWAPRILHSRITLNDGVQRVLDYDDFRNYGREDMIVHGIAITPNNLYQTVSRDDVTVRVKVGSNGWMIGDRRLPVGTLQNTYPNRIHVPNIPVPPNTQIVIDLLNNSGGNYSNLDIAVFGSAKVRP